MNTVVIKPGSLTPVGPDPRMVSTRLRPGEVNGQHVQICALEIYGSMLVLKLSLVQGGLFWGCGLTSGMFLAWTLGPHINYRKNSIGSRHITSSSFHMHQVALDIDLDCSCDEGNPSCNFSVTRSSG